MRFPTRLRPLGLLALTTLVFWSGQSLAQTESPDTVARRLQQTYGAVQTLQANFVQRIGTPSLTGTLRVKDDAFRLDLGSQVFVTDGETLWSYSSDDQQVVVQAYDPSQVGFSVGQLFTDYLRVFRVTGATSARIGGVAHDVLTLRPREAGSSVRDATLYVRSSDGIPTRVRVHDANGATLAFDLSNVRLNQSMPASTFQFSAPRGTEVVDLR